MLDEWYYGSLEKKSAEAKINSKVVYLGRVSDDKMSLIYSAADTFISPVLYDEGYATVYLEALSCGTPVISSRRGCLPYFLSPEVAELLDHVDDTSVLQSVETQRLLATLVAPHSGHLNEFIFSPLVLLSLFSLAHYFQAD